MRGNTALMLIVSNPIANSQELFDQVDAFIGLLIERKADLLAVNHDLETALNIAAALGHQRIIGSILKHGRAKGTDTSLLLKFKGGIEERTPLSIAAKENKKEALDVMLSEVERIRGGGARGERKAREIVNEQDIAGKVASNNGIV
jgi:ankyrin repeat protein